MTDFNDTNRNNAPVQPEPAAADAARTEPQAAPAEAQAPAAETAGAQNAPETAPAEENAAPKLTADPAEVAARAEAVVAEIEDAEIPPAPEMPVPPVQNTAAQPPYTPPPAPPPPVICTWLSTMPGIITLPDMSVSSPSKPRGKVRPSHIFITLSYHSRISFLPRFSGAST